MINPDAELSRLRWILQNSGWSHPEVDDVISQASKDINETILDIVSNAISEATDYAQDIGAEEFIDQIDIREIGGFFYISTISGQTNFSTPAREMLPDLLKNAKVNPKTGVKSKVIPIGGKKTTMPGNSFTAIQDRQAHIQEARQSLTQSTSIRSSGSSSSMASEFKAVIERNLAVRKANRAVSDSNSLNMSFKTASSNQDAATQWVYPAKELDLTGYLMELNKRMQDAMEDIVPRLINSYIEEYS